PRPLGRRRRPPGQLAAHALGVAAPPPPRMRVRLGGRLRRALRRRVSRLCRLPGGLRVMDGQRGESVPGAIRRPDLPEHGGEYRPLPRTRREREDVPGPAAFWLLLALGLVDEVAAADLRPALGGAADIDVYLDRLDAERRVGLPQQRPLYALPRRRAVLAQGALDAPGRPQRR